MSKIKGLITLLALGAFIAFIVSCNNAPKVKSRKADHSLKKVRESGKLVAVADFNSTNYFIYRGEPMGYQFELLNLLADHLGVKLEITVSNDIERNFDLLINNECDIIAQNLAITKERSKIIDFTVPHSQTRQVLVQRKEVLNDLDSHTPFINNQLDLANKVVYVQKNSSYADRLRNLSDEIGDTIHMIEKDNLEDEELIAKVANEEIDYTVADENVALVNSTYYPNLDVSLDISFPQNLAWGVRQGDDSLQYVVNEWLSDFKETVEYRHIYNKYFKNRRTTIIAKSDHYTVTSGQISKYDDLIKQYSKEVDWDWRLLASLIYQESRFVPKVKSWAGAFGLMQLMPSTAKRFGVNYNSSPEQQIRGGVEFIKWLDRRFVNRGINDQEERIKFILASYNVGLGHIIDARTLAKKNDKNPDIWEANVDTFILKKSLPQYYTDPDVQYGYCRGTETYNYVYEILERYEHYKNIISE